MLGLGFVFGHFPAWYYQHIMNHMVSPTVSLTPLQLFKALSDITRLSCLMLILHEKRICVCELEHALNEDQPKVSRHLALLRKDGIVTTERSGKWVYYTLSPTLPIWAYDILHIAQTENDAFTEKLIHNLSHMCDRPSCC